MSAVTAADFVATDPVAVLQAYSALADMGRSAEISALLLDGPPGTGKTYFGKFVASLLQARLLHFQIFPGCGREDLLYDEVTPTGSRPGCAGAGVPGPAPGPAQGVLLQAIGLSREQPVVALFDEWDKADVRVDSFMLNFLQEGELFLPRLGRLVADPCRLLVVITKNDQREVSSPLLRRCRVAHLEWPDPAVEKMILRRRLPQLSGPCCDFLLELANRLRHNPEVGKPPSTPELARLARDLLRLVALGTPGPILGRYFVAAVAPRMEDRRRFVEKSPVYYGTRVQELFGPLAAGDPGDRGPLREQLARWLGQPREEGWAA